MAETDKSKGSLYFDDEANFQTLVAQMPEAERDRYLKYGHHRIEPAFENRIFVLYKPTGKHGSAASEVEILDYVRVVEIGCSFKDGLSIYLENETGESQRVIYVPRPLFGRRVFVSIPTNIQLKWNAREHKGQVLHSLSCALLIKTRNKASFKSVGNIYLETINSFRTMFPELADKLRI